ncbi:hypothetical protein P5673_030368 [Acropora cervicornis]|uniref:Uncharacterized protein n=1 Tax=Acropora cervicornis TaxID=6130 RepID=A0AAD9PUD0_ACRCE|nr:hypothetical protein P5673_030368 [Acropora cervicornis]
MGTVHDRKTAGRPTSDVPLSDHYCMVRSFADVRELRRSVNAPVNNKEPPNDDEGGPAFWNQHKDLALQNWAQHRIGSGMERGMVGDRCLVDLLTCTLRQAPIVLRDSPRSCKCAAKSIGSVLSTFVCAFPCDAANVDIDASLGLSLHLPLCLQEVKNFFLEHALEKRLESLEMNLQTLSGFIARLHITFKLIVLLLSLVASCCEFFKEDLPIKIQKVREQDARNVATKDVVVDVSSTSSEEESEKEEVSVNSTSTPTSSDSERRKKKSQTRKRKSERERNRSSRSHSLERTLKQRDVPRKRSASYSPPVSKSSKRHHDESSSDESDQRDSDDRKRKKRKSTKHKRGSARGDVMEDFRATTEELAESQMWIDDNFQRVLKKLVHSFIDAEN